MDAFQKAYAKLNPEQREAVDHIGGPLLVIAGPGTGKTQLLSVRVANILEKTDAGPDNILCLTFTEAGASNMKNRLASFIGPEAYKIPIMTYHAFGSYILQDSREEIATSIDEAERFLLIRDIQSRLDADDILRKNHQTKDIIAAISKAKSANLKPADLLNVASENEKTDRELYALIENDLDALNHSTYKKGGREIYERLLATFQNYSQNHPQYILGKVENIAVIYFRSLADIFANEQEGKSLADPLRKWRDKYFRKDQNDRFVFKNDISTLKLRSLANIMQQYLDYLEQNAKIDYDDMILGAIELLKTESDKRFTAQERYQYILLDEFQDTNPAQMELVQLLTDNENIEHPNIMAVGDDDQAIFGFQGAEASNFFDFDAHYHPRQIFLTKNYRSSAEILEFAHNVIEQSPDRFCKAENVQIDKRISAENPPKSTKIEIREYACAQEEYSAVATQIRALLDQGTEATELAIIVPRHKYLGELLPYLRSENIPVSYERSENILDDPQIALLLKAARLTLALAQSPAKAEEYWLEILSQKCWNITTENITTLSLAAYKNRRLLLEEMNDNEIFQPVANFFMELAAKSESHSTDFLLDQLTHKFFPTSSENFQLYSYLNTLRDTIPSEKAPKLADFMHAIDGYQQAELSILDKSPYSDGDDAVSLMSVHKSKGLEFAHVFLIQSDDEVWSNAGGNRQQLMLPPNFDFINYHGDSNDEKIRVFFVALTRAKSHLYLSSSLANFAGKKTTRLKYLDAREDETGAVSLAAPKDHNQILASEATSVAPDDISTKRWLDNYLPSNETRKNYFRAQVENFKLSATHVNTFVDLTYGGPATFFERYILRAPTSGSEVLDYGNCVHQVMDEFAKENLSDAAALARLLALIDQLPGDTEEKAKLRTRAEKEFREFLAARSNALRACTTRTELGFPNETITIGDAVLTGRIDRLEIDEESKTITVVDFKTGAPKDKISDNYKFQLYFYKFLIEGSREFQGYRVNAGRIEYIPKNEAGEHVQHVVDFKPAKISENKKLIQAVFQHIKSLDFPDTSELTTAKFRASLIAEIA